MGNSYPIINLVGHRRDVRLQENVHRRRLMHKSMVVTGVYLFLLATVVVIRFLLMSQFSDVESSIVTTKSNISGMESKEAKHRLISSKLSELSKFIDNKKPIQPKINMIYAIMPKGVFVEDISFGESEETLSVRVRADDVFEVGDFLSAIIRAVETDFSQIIVSSTRRSEDGAYNLDLEFQFENG